MSDLMKKAEEYAAPCYVCGGTGRAVVRTPYRSRDGSLQDTFSHYELCACLTASRQKD